MKLSQIQLRFMGRAKAGMHLAYGAIRSGKTYVQLYTFIAWLVADAKPGISCLLTAKKRDAIERNLFDPFRKILSEEPELAEYFEFKSQPYRVFFKPKDIECWCEGANDDRSHEKIRGITIQAWVGDEVTLYPETFFRECIARLSAGARLALLTCNPNSLLHYVYRDFIVPNKIFVYPFKLTDNHTLHSEYLEMIKSNYTGVEYTRFIEGDWGGSEEDMVLPEYHKMRESILQTFEMPQYLDPMTAIDVGWRDFTVAIMGHYDMTSDTVYIDNELVIKKNMTTDILARSMIDMELDTWGREAKERWTDIDLRLIEDMNRMHGITLFPTRKDNKDAQVNTLRVLMRNDKLRINPRCVELDQQILGATWAKNRGEKRSYNRTEEHGHFDAVDALIYFVRNIRKQDPNPTQESIWQSQGLFLSPKYQKKQSQWEALTPPALKAPGSASNQKTAFPSRLLSFWKAGR